MDTQVPQFEDLEVQCSEGDRCLSGGVFVWTVGEQQFYYEKGFTDPKRCKPCRDRKNAGRAKREQQVQK